MLPCSVANGVYYFPSFWRIFENCEKKSKKFKNVKNLYILYFAYAPGTHCSNKNSFKYERKKITFVQRSKRVLLVYIYIYIIIYNMYVDRDKFWGKAIHWLPEELLLYRFLHTCVKNSAFFGNRQKNGEHDFLTMKIRIYANFPDFEDVDKNLARSSIFTTLQAFGRLFFCIYIGVENSEVSENYKKMGV